MSLFLRNFEYRKSEGKDTFLIQDMSYSPLTNQHLHLFQPSYVHAKAESFYNLELCLSRKYPFFDSSFEMHSSDPHGYKDRGGKPGIISRASFSVQFLLVPL